MSWGLFLDQFLQKVPDITLLIVHILQEDQLYSTIPEVLLFVPITGGDPSLAHPIMSDSAAAAARMSEQAQTSGDRAATPVRKSTR